MRMVSLAPITRPDDLVPAIVTRAPTPAADCFRNERRDRCAMALAFPEEGRRVYGGERGESGVEPHHPSAGGAGQTKNPVSRRFGKASQNTLPHVSSSAPAA